MSLKRKPRPASASPHADPLDSAMALLHAADPLEALQSILDAVPNPVFVKDQSHRLILVNQALCELLGADREALVGRSDYDLVSKEQAEVFVGVDDEVFSTGGTRENEEVITDGSGAVRVIVTRKRRIALATRDGARHFIVAVISDVTRFREAEARAQYLAQHDALTGLPNRVRLSETLRMAVDAGQRSGSKLALLLLDLDGFKAINDQRGHAEGDEVLRIVGRRLSGLVREGDIVARLGGDEFCIVQTGIADAASASALADRVVGAIAQPIAVGSGRAQVSASIGIALFPEDAEAPETLLHCADLALYTVKRSGRNGHARFGLPPTPVDSEVSDLEADLRSAMEHGQLSLAFQPLAAAADGSMRGFEALARWDHPLRGEISPAVFIPVAESTGLIHALGAWVLRQACRAAAQWPWEVQVAVNVSPAQMESGDFPAVVEAALAESGLPARRLELEITETALLGSSGRVLDSVKRLKAMGVTLALDDFGAGWSSLDSLRRFPFDRIKIDRSFVATMQSDTRSAAIVRAVLSLGQSLNLPVTAEGVEVPAQLTALRQMGCDELQGYLIGSPSAEAVEPNKDPWADFSLDE